MRESDLKTTVAAFASTAKGWRSVMFLEQYLWDGEDFKSVVLKVHVIEKAIQVQPGGEIKT